MVSHLVYGKYVNTGQSYIVSFVQVLGYTEISVSLAELELDPTSSQEELDALRMESDTWALLQTLTPCATMFLR